MSELDEKTGGLWSTFQAELTRRMEAGAREYGDASFHKTAPRTLTEIQEELLDVCGWGFILYVRLERLRAELEKVDA